MELYNIISVFFLIGAVAVYKINSSEKDASKNKNRWLKFLTYLVLVFGQLALIGSGNYWYFAILIAATGFYEMVCIQKTIKHNPGRLILYLVFGLFYILFFKQITIKMQQFVFVIVITFDGYSQLTGELAGRTKLFPKVSPNKTLEGLTGGLLSALITAVLLSRILDIAIIQALVFGLLICVFAITGDFLASYYKRIHAVKDFSKIIPGHGGILDRFDSLIMAGFGFYFIEMIDFSNQAIMAVTAYTLIFGVIFLLAEIGRHTFRLKAEYTRKWVHLSSGLCCLSFPFFINDHWLVLVLCSGFMMVLYISSKKGLLGSVNDIDRKSYGSLLFPVAVYLSFLCFEYFGKSYIYFYLPIIILAVCDPLAALVGKRWAYGKYAVGKDHKTIVGSAVFFVSCFIILLISFQSPDLKLSTGILFLNCFIISTAASLTEAISRNGMDNITIPVCVMAALILLH